MPSVLIQPSASTSGNVAHLNPQMRVFVEALKADPKFNPTNAARKAGYKNPSQAANKLLKNEIVRAAIGRALLKRCNELKIDANRVLTELAHIGFANPQKMFRPDGTLMGIHEMPEDIARAISSFDVDMRTVGKGEDAEVMTVVKVRFWSKNEALQLIAKHLGMLDERFKVEHDLSSGLLQTLIGKIEEDLKGEGPVIDAKSIESAVEEQR